MNQGISVVIPAYNYRRFISEALESVLSQTHTHFEVIIVDDGSTDDTRKVVSRFSDHRIRYIFQTNQGLSAARNTGILNARFAYVAFLDADDYWLPTMLASALDRFSRGSEDLGIVACGSLRVTEQGLAIDKGAELRGRECDYQAEEIVLKSRFMPSTVVARAHVFTQVGGFDTTLRSSEDRDMWIRIAARYRVHYYSDPLVRIRKHDHNMSKNADRMRLNMRKVLAKWFHSGIRQHSQFTLWLKSHSFHYFEVAWMYYDERRVPKAISSLLISLALWPLFVAPREALGKPLFFRSRALARFLVGWINWEGR